MPDTDYIIEVSVHKNDRRVLYKNTVIRTGINIFVFDEQSLIVVILRNIESPNWIGNC